MRVVVVHQHIIGRKEIPAMRPQTRGQRDLLAMKIKQRVIGHFVKGASPRKQTARAYKGTSNGRRRSARIGHRARVKSQHPLLAEDASLGYGNQRHPQLARRHISRRITRQHRFERGTVGQHLDESLVPARRKTRMAVHLQHIALIFTQLRENAVTSPANALARGGRHTQLSHLRVVWREAVVVRARHHL